METVSVTLNVPKESKEILDAVLGLIEDIRAKKELGAIAGENLPALMTAIDGYDKLGAEMKGPERSDLVAYSSKKLVDMLMPVKSEPAE